MIVLNCKRSGKDFKMATNIQTRRLSNILIIGNVGVGKALVANSICGKYHFDAKESFLLNTSGSRSEGSEFNKELNTQFNFIIADTPDATPTSGNDFFSQIDTTSFSGYFNLIIYVIKAGHSRIKDIKIILDIIRNECTDEFKSIFCVAVNMGETANLFNAEQMKKRLFQDNNLIADLIHYASKGVIFINIPDCSLIDKRSLKVLSRDILKISHQSSHSYHTENYNKELTQKRENIVKEDREPIVDAEEGRAEERTDHIKIDENTELYLKMISCMFEESKVKIQALVDQCRLQKRIEVVFFDSNARKCCLL